MRDPSADIRHWEVRGDADTLTFSVTTAAPADLADHQAERTLAWNLDLGTGVDWEIRIDIPFDSRGSQAGEGVGLGDIPGPNRIQCRPPATQRGAAVEVSVPRRCLGSPRQIRLQASYPFYPANVTAGVTGSLDRAPDGGATIGTLV